MSTPPPVTRLRQCLAALTLLAIAGCGGGDFAELFVKLITAHFVPAEAIVAPGGALHADLEVTCDRAGLDTAFGRLGLRVKLDPNHTLAGGVTATAFGSPDPQGFYAFPCATPTGDPDLRVAHIPVTVGVAVGTPPLSTTLSAYIEMEPLSSGQSSKDSTTADLMLTVNTAAAPGLGGNLLANAAFDESVGVGGLPTAPGNWHGDPGRIVGTDHDIAPRSAATMLRFDGSASAPGGSSASSRQWQVVDLAGFRDAVSTGTVSARLAAFYNCVGGFTAGSRFDVSLFAYDGAMADLPARYAAGTHLAAQTTTLEASGFAWQEAAATLTLPATTTYVLVEIRASERFLEVGAFAGNYADDASLTLSAVPPAGARP